MTKDSTSIKGCSLLCTNLFLTFSMPGTYVSHTITFSLPPWNKLLLPLLLPWLDVGLWRNRERARADRRFISCVSLYRQLSQSTAGTTELHTPSQHSTSLQNKHINCPLCKPYCRGSINVKLQRPDQSENVYFIMQFLQNQWLVFPCSDSKSKDCRIMWNMYSVRVMFILR